MSELALFANGSLSRLSHVAKRLENRGRLRREPDPDNGRFTVATLTEAGWAKVADSAPAHVATVRRQAPGPAPVTSALRAVSSCRTGNAYRQRMRRTP
ncbi:MarR family winged helix-turn-helix transcriptional regulator [Streptomyces sp. NPDC004270]